MRVLFPYTKPLPDGGYRQCVYEAEVEVKDGQYVLTPIKPRYWQLIPPSLMRNVFMRAKSGKPYYYMGVKSILTVVYETAFTSV